MDAEFLQRGEALDYTNSGATTITAGTLVLVAGQVGVVINDIAAGAKGAAQVKGVANIRKANEAIPAALPVGWDANGNPKVGTAGTGCATSLLGACMAAGDMFLGSAVYAAAAANEFVAVDLNQFSAIFPAWPNRYHQADTTGTLDNTDGGKVLRIATVDQTLTLPEIATVAIGTEVIIVNDCADGASILTIAPNAADGFNGFGITHAVNKTLANTKATSKRGDFIRLLACGDTHWQVLERKGIWARQA